MTGIADGCARAASGHANVLPMNVMNSRRCMYLNTILRLCKRSTLRRAARENLYPFGSRKRDQARCRLRVNRVILTLRRRLPVYPDKQTFSEPAGMSQTCH